MTRITALLGASALAVSPAAALAQTKVSHLPAGAAVAAGDLVPMSQSCTGSPPTATCTATNAVSGAQLKTWAQSGLSAASLTNGVTGSGAVVLATSPSLVTPQLGVAKVTTLAGKNAVSSITPGAAAQVGTGATAACAASHVCDSLSGEITLTTGTGTLASGLLVTINFADTRAAPPNCVLSPAQQAGVTVKSLTWSATTSAVAASTFSALAASAAYQIDYVCGGG